jgi:hypothetical protein
MKAILFCLALLGAVVGRGQIVLDWYGAPPPPATLLLDDYSGAAGAWSLRLLRTAYTGDCIVVRRASDNALDTIGFAGGVLDTATLKTFCASTDCFVTTWYDQSSNGYDLTQTTNANQPRIVSGGVVDRCTDGFVGLYANVGASMSVPSSTATFKFMHDGTLYSTSVVAQFGLSANPNIVMGVFGNNAGTGSNVGVFQLYDDRSALSRNDMYLYNVSRGGSNIVNVAVNNSIAPNTLKAIYTNNDPGNATAANRHEAYVDNGSNISNNIATGIPSTANSTFDFEIMSVGNRVGLFQGYYNELVIWNTSQSSNRTGIQSNINSFYSIY